MKSWYIYKITNNLNSKSYVGQRGFDGDPIKDSYFGSGIALKKSIKKYGKENFTKEILHYGIETKKRADTAEIFEIWNQCTLSPNGYNLTQGGGGCIVSDETRKKLSDSKIGKPRSDETRKKISEAEKGDKGHNYGKTFSEETRKKMSESFKGRKYSEETRKKMSEAHKGNKNYFYGKKHSEETRKKMSEGQKRRQNIKRS